MLTKDDPRWIEGANGSQIAGACEGLVETRLQAVWDALRRYAETQPKNTQVSATFNTDNGRLEISTSSSLAAHEIYDTSAAKAR